MKFNPTSALKYGLLLVAGIFLVWITFKGQDIQKLWFDLKNANYLWVSLSTLACLFAHFIRAVRWRMLIKTLNHNPKLLNTFHAVMVGYLANLALPRMGEISRCAILVKTDKIPANSLLGTVIIERFIDLIMLMIIVLLAIMLQFDIIIDFFTANLSFNKQSIIQTALIAVIIILVACFGGYFLYKLLIKNKENGLGGKIFNILIGLKEGILSVIKMKQKGWFIFHSFFIWFLYFLSTYLCFFAINATSNLTTGAAFSVLVFGSLAMLAPVQGGIGAYHWMVSQGLLIYNIAKADGLAYATIIHSSQTIVILIIGSISLVIVFLSPQKKLTLNINR